MRDNNQNESANKNEDEYKIEQTRHGTAQHTQHIWNQGQAIETTTSRQMAMGAENRHKFVPFVVAVVEAEHALHTLTHTHAHIDPQDLCVLKYFCEK